MHPLFCERRARFVGSGDGESLVCVLDCPFISLIAKRSTLGNCSARANPRVRECVRGGICSSITFTFFFHFLCVCYKFLPCKRFNFSCMSPQHKHHQFVNVFKHIRDSGRRFREFWHSE